MAQGPMASAIQYSDAQKKKGLAAVLTLYFCVMFFTYILMVAGPGHGCRPEWYVAVLCSYDRTFSVLLHGHVDLRQNV